MHDKNCDPNFPIKIHHAEGPGKKWWFTPLKFNKLIPSPDAEGVTFFQTMFSIYVRGNSGMNLLLFTVLHIGFNKKHPIGFNKKHPTSLLSSYHIYIYIILVVGGVLSLKHPIGMCVDQFQFLHLQCLMSPSLSQSSNQKWMRFH